MNDSKRAVASQGDLSAFLADTEAALFIGGGPRVPWEMVPVEGYVPIRDRY